LVVSIQLMFTLPVFSAFASSSHDFYVLYLEFLYIFFFFHGVALQYQMLMLQNFPHIKINNKLAGSHSYFIIFGNEQRSF